MEGYRNEYHQPLLPSRESQYENCWSGPQGIVPAGVPIPLMPGLQIDLRHDTSSLLQHHNPHDDAQPAVSSKHKGEIACPNLIDKQKALEFFCLVGLSSNNLQVHSRHNMLLLSNCCFFL